MTRSQADELSLPVVRAYMDAEDEILRMIAEQLAADGDLSDTSKWRIRQLARAGALDRKAIEIIKSYMPVISDETDELITAAAMSEIAYTDAAFQRAAADGIKGIAAEVPAEVTAFKVMKRFHKQAHHDMNLVNTVMGYETKKVYRKAVNEVYTAVHHDLGVGTASLISGQESLQAAVRSTIRRMSREGIPAFVDAAGHEWSPEAYVTMDLRTTAMNTARQAQFDRCDDYGIDLIEVSSHMGARPLCAPYQGRIYSRGGASGETKDGSGRTIYYSPLSQTSYGEPAGLFGINCGHIPYPFVPGANIQRYFPYDEKENAEAYEKSQVQRKLERDIRASKRECMMLDAAGDKEGYTKAAQKLKTRRENYKAYCKANGLGTQPERTQVYGFDRSQSSKAVWAERKSSAAGLTSGAATTAPSVMHMVKPGMASSMLGGTSSPASGSSSAIISSKSLPKWLTTFDADGKIDIATFRQELAAGNVNTKIDMNQQQKHMNTKVWKNIVKQAFDPRLNPTGKTVPKSRLYKTADPQAIVDKYSGTGDFKAYKNNKSVSEFVTLPSPVGVSFDKKIGKYIPTDRVQIKYTQSGVHVFPVLNGGIV